jgi:hypothetical protein
MPSAGAETAAARATFHTCAAPRILQHVPARDATNAKPRTDRRPSMGRGRNTLRYDEVWTSIER